MKYRFGLDVGGLVLFLLVIIPTIVATIPFGSSHCTRMLSMYT